MKHIQKEKNICWHWDYNKCRLFPKSIAITR